MKIIKILTPAILAVLTTLVIVKTFSLPVSAQAVPTGIVFYVDAVNGDDTNGDGSQGAPWRTLTYATSRIHAGDTLIVMPGTYNTALGEWFPIRIPADSKLIGVDKSTTILSGNPDSPVLHIGVCCSDFTSATLVSDLTLQGGKYGVYLYAGDTNQEPIFSNLLIQGNSRGVWIYSSGVNGDDTRIGAVFSNTEITANTADGVHINATGLEDPSTIEVVFQNSRIHHNAGNGIYMDSHFTGTIAEPTIRDSQIYENSNHGIHVSGGSGAWGKPRVENSFIYENGKYGLYWEKEAEALSNFDGSFTNVIVARNQMGGIYLDRTQDHSSRLQVTNSNLVDNLGYGIHWTRNAGEVHPEIVNTILWNPDADDLYSTGEAWSAAEVQFSLIEDSDLFGQMGNLYHGPLFLDDYHLEPCSPAVNRGTASGAPDEDLDGGPRPLGSGYDIGADENDGRCDLEAQKSVSHYLAQIGDTLAYTITMYNSTTSTPLDITLTDPLSADLIYQEGTLWASQGTSTYEAGQVSWLGSIPPGEVVSLGFQANVRTGNTIIPNRATADAGVGSVFDVLECKTAVDPYTVYLPILLEDYCKITILDDFSDPASGWPSAVTEDWIYGYRDQEYRMYARSGYSFMAVSRGDLDQRYNLSVDIHQVAGYEPEYGTYGLIFGLLPDWSEFYTFEIYPYTQEWFIYRYDATGWHLVVSSMSSFIQPGLAVNTLQIKWREQVSGIDFYGLLINGGLVQLWTLGIPDRYVGLAATSATSGFESRYDNYSFTPSECVGIATAVDSINQNSQSVSIRIMDISETKNR